MMTGWFRAHMKLRMSKIPTSNSLFRNSFCLEIIHKLTFFHVLCYFELLGKLLSTPTVLTKYSPKLLFPAWLFITSYSSCDLSNKLWLFFSITGWLENPQRSKMVAGTLPLKILVRVRACHCRGAARWMFMAYPYFTNTTVNKTSSQMQGPSSIVQDCY